MRGAPPGRVRRTMALPPHCRTCWGWEMMGTWLGWLTSGARARNKYTTTATYLQPHTYNISTGGHDNIILYIPTQLYTHPHTHTRKHTYTYARRVGSRNISLKNVTSHDPAINHVCFIYCYCYYYYYYIICVIRSKPLSARVRPTLCDLSPQCCYAYCIVLTIVIILCL